MFRRLALVAVFVVIFAAGLLMRRSESAPRSACNVEIVKQGPYAGIWITNDKGLIGLVATEHHAPYLVMYGSDYGMPALALALGEDERPVVQLPGPDGKTRSVRQVPISQLLPDAK